MSILEQLVRRQGFTNRRVRNLERKLDEPDPMGWVNPGETWTYASASTFTIADNGDIADLTDRYQAGDFIRLKQGGAFLHFIISEVSYSDPDTTVTIDCLVSVQQEVVHNLMNLLSIAPHLGEPPQLPLDLRLPDAIMG